MLYPVIIAGGVGSRLWPLSRQSRPKQFLALGQNKFSMLETTLARIASLKYAKPFVVCNESHRFLVAESLRKLGKLQRNIILEPLQKNTAPAITLAALAALDESAGEDPLLLVLSADHFIKDEAAFIEVVNSAMPLALKGYMVTFGVVPNKPETGYGYIKKSTPVDGVNYAYHIDTFVEKPNYDKAKEYVDSGDFVWNSGMFLFKASSFIDELTKYQPAILNACKLSMVGACHDLDFIRIRMEDFSLCSELSIDYAVMEHTKKSIVVPLNVGWSDVGSWSSLWEISKKDSCGNVIHGDIISYNSKNNFIFTDANLVTTVGVDDLIIIQTKDALLVSTHKSVQDVKEIVEILKKEGRCEYHSHREIFRPWGKYDSIDSGERYQIKRITVSPGESLSLQIHYHRAEHWIILSGTALITLGKEERILCENQSIYIPQGVEHSLANPGKIPLELVEVRSGAYIEEDDIIRIADKYGRT